MGAAECKPLAAHLEWLQLRGLSASTIRRRRVVLGWVRDSLPRGELLKATAADLRAWRARLDVAPDAVSVYVSHVSQFYRWAVEQGLLDASPAASLPAPRRSHPLPRPIGEQALLEAVAAAPPRIRPWLVLAGWAGLRACEIAALRRENVLDTASPPVLYIAENATKGHHERVVPLSPFVLGELARHGLPASGWVFPRHDGKPGPNTAARISQAASGYFGSIGIQASLHQLRHRFGTQMYRVRRDLRTTQEAMGHAHPSTTAGYAAIDQADIADDISALPLPDTGNAALRLHENDGLDSYSWLSIGTR